MVDFRNRLSYSAILYHVWLVASILCAIAAVWCTVVGEWAWVLGWVVASIALSAHARVERLDGHTHRSGVEAP